MFENLLLVLLVVQGVFLLATLVYIVTSLHFEDRIVGTNLVGTIIINFIAVLAVYMGEGYGVDIALVYAFLSFLAVVVLCRLLAVQHVERQIIRAEKAEKKKEKSADAAQQEKRGAAQAAKRAQFETESEALRRQLEALRRENESKGGAGV